MYISEKLDLLIQYLLVDPFQALFARVFKREARAPTLTLSIADAPTGRSAGGTLPGVARAFDAASWQASLAPTVRECVHAGARQCSLRAGRRPRTGVMSLFIVNGPIPD
jgi:hypothetical protein